MSEPEINSELEGQLAALADLEKEFEKVELELQRETIKKQAPLFERRDKVIDAIPGFWAGVFEACSDELGFDEHITPEDAVVISSITSLRITRPDIEEPRNIDIYFAIHDNDYTEACDVTKKFTYLPGRNSQEEAILVSEPVTLKWKPGKDLTSGINELAIEAFAERKAAKEEGDAGKGKSKKSQSEAEQKLQAILEKDTNTSFFYWLSYSGLHEWERAEEETDDPLLVEAFPWGEEVAIPIAEDLYPGAVKYWTESLQQEEEDDEDENAEVNLDSDLEEQLMKGIVKKGGSSNKSKRNGDATDGDEPAKKKAKK